MSGSSEEEDTLEDQDNDEEEEEEDDDNLKESDAAKEVPCFMGYTSPQIHSTFSEGIVFQTKMYTYVSSYSFRTLT